MRMYDIIEKKRDGYELSEEEIRFVVDGYTEGRIADYQVSAWLMAIYFQGMTLDEAAYLTMAMAHSGECLQLDQIKGIKLDKHSTGGVGDTTSLILIPLVASLGIPIAKMSGRGLGHTGGTIDKLEAIEGFHVELSEESFIEQVQTKGLSIIGQSKNLAPADKLLYSLRDVTATVDSIPLIASSIMSKKIASGADKIVLDVKVGKGAFMKDLANAQALANTMVEIGKRVGLETRCLITNMDQPLGHAIGNAIEVREAIETLQGKGPKDLTELVLELAAHMICLADRAKQIDEAKDMAKEQLENGQALAYFKRLIQAQGGKVSLVEDVSRLPRATYTVDIRAKASGYLTDIHTDELGRVLMLLGAGRKTTDDQIDLSVGLYLHKKIGDAIEVNDLLCTIYTNDPQHDAYPAMIESSIVISQEKRQLELILDTIT